MIRRTVGVLREQWFIVAMLAAIALAHAAPEFGRSGGPLRPELVVRKLGLFIIFWTAGLNIRASQLAAAAAKVRVHLLVALTSLAAVPAAVFWLLRPLLAVGLSAAAAASAGGAVPAPHPSPAAASPHAVPAATVAGQAAPQEWIAALGNGLLVLACLPSPVGSSLILTRACAGNEATSIFNSTLGSLLGIVATPALVFVFLGHAGSVPFIQTLTSLGSTVLVPLLAGQVSRLVIERIRPSLLSLPFSQLSSFVLLGIIYSTFCDAFYVPPAGSAAALAKRSANLPLAALAVLEATLVGLHLMCLLLVRQVGEHILGIERADNVAAMFSAAQKSLTLGIPMVNVLFGDRPDFAVVVLPLLMYHPTQILLDSMLTGALRAWVLADRRSSTKTK
ncbi:LRR receptor-like serine/threonine-protein kinase RGI2 [Polyrhizophydium stewartii]|uniref:LRR receptor-like serine/threonine-protein kinase RGI2 n=1 Tax=Polyrhizophydium stewartii TaxID=2732419 RepID=A0ABR4MX47_9FUNG